MHSDSQKLHRSYLAMQFWLPVICNVRRRLKVRMSKKIIIEVVEDDALAIDADALALK